MTYEGLFVAPVTPMARDGAVNFDLVEDLAELLITRGARGFYLCGGTGEGMLLTLPERMRLVETWISAVSGKVPLLVHVGHACLEDAKTLARHAAGLKVAGISSVAPPVCPARDIATLVAFLGAIAAAAPRLPMYYYHNTASAGPKMRGIDFLEAARDSIPNLGGLKFTHEDLMDLNRCLRFADGRYDVMFGKDEIMLGALATGAKAFIGGSFNLLAPLAGQIYQAFHRGDMDEARRVNAQLVDAVAVLGSFGGLPALKASIALLGVDCGPCRLPLRTLSDLEREKLAERIAPFANSARQREHGLPQVKVLRKTPAEGFAQKRLLSR